MLVNSTIEPNLRVNLTYLDFGADAKLNYAVHTDA